MKILDNIDPELKMLWIYIIGIVFVFLFVYSLSVQCSYNAIPYFNESSQQIFLK